MSRVKGLSGLHLVNLDPKSIKASDSAIMEYSYLRKTFLPELPSLPSHNRKAKAGSGIFQNQL